MFACPFGVAPPGETAAVLAEAAASSGVSTAAGAYATPTYAVGAAASIVLRLYHGHESAMPAAAATAAAAAAAAAIYELDSATAVAAAVTAAESSDSDSAVAAAAAPSDSTDATAAHSLPIAPASASSAGPLSASLSSAFSPVASIFQLPVQAPPSAQPVRLPPPPSVNLKRPGKLVVYHGGAPARWPSILRNGLQILSGTMHQAVGAVFGRGIYTAQTAAVSWGYPPSRALPDWSLTRSPQLTLHGFIKTGRRRLLHCD